MNKLILSPPEIAENYLNLAGKKASQRPTIAFILACMAGMMIAIAGAAATVAAATVENSSAARLISAAVFPVGLCLVLVAGSELFTGNTLMIVSLLKEHISLTAMLKSWIIVYCGNLIGSIFIAALFIYGHSASQFNGQIATNLVNIAVAKCSLSFSDAFIRGILCNFLVCLAVWMSFAALTVQGKIIACYLPVFTFVLSGYEHSIANMFYISAGIFASTEYAIPAPLLTPSAMWTINLIPVTLGNIIGGSLLVGCLYYFAYLKNHSQ